MNDEAVKDAIIRRCDPDRAQAVFEGYKRVNRELAPLNYEVMLALVGMLGEIAVQSGQPDAMVCQMLGLLVDSIKWNVERAGEAGIDKRVFEMAQGRG